MRYVVVDLEATCWESNQTPARMEIIEIGAVLLATAAGPIVGDFDTFVQPVVERELSDFCTLLTSIRQSDVDAAPTFPRAFASFVDWIGSEPFELCSWGQFDLEQFRIECQRHSVLLPKSFERHVNIKKEFANLFKVPSCGMDRALRIAGIPLEGRHHRANDDARNIARLAMLVLPKLEAGQKSRGGGTGT